MNMTFDKFIVGTSNQRAYYAAIAAALHPNHKPLLLCGETGLGKTHLLHGIRHAVEKEHQARVVLTSGEKFYTGLLNAIQKDTIVEFRKAFCVADYLLFDNFSFIANKKQAMEEFSLILCTLVNSGRQVVVASTLAPDQLSALDARVRSFLELVLVVDIEATDEKMGRSILLMRSEEMQVKLPEEVIAFLAQKLPTPRLLESSLIWMTAYANIFDESLTMKLAEQYVDKYKNGG